MTSNEGCDPSPAVSNSECADVACTTRTTGRGNPISRSAKCSAIKPEAYFVRGMYNSLRGMGVTQIADAMLFAE